MNAVDPKSVTIRGRLSFPVLTIAEALERNKTSQFPKDSDDKVKAEFNLVVEQDQFDKIREHIRTHFLPYAAEQARKGEKRDALDSKAIAKLQAMLADGGDWTDTPPHIPMKELSDKNKEYMPEGVASVKVTGPKGADIQVKASVWSEDQLSQPDPDILRYPILVGINRTDFEAYPGATVLATLDLFSYQNSKAVYGINASASTIVYDGRYETDRLGGGTLVDEDAIFAD